MWLTDLFVEQLRELWAERGRVGLVALGVAWGTLSLTLLVAFGRGLEEGTIQTVETFGVNLLRVGGGATSRSFEGLSAGRWTRLQVEDEGLLAAGLPEARTVALEYSRGSEFVVRFGDKKTSAPLSGTGPEFRDLRGMRPQAGGRFVNERDVREHRRVCFLGHRTKLRLFGEAPAVGAEVELLGVPFLVIGVRQPLVAISSYNGDDRAKITIPHTTFRDLMGPNQISFLFVELESDEQRKAAVASIYQLLGSRHGFDPEDRNALGVQDFMVMQDMIGGMLDGNRYLNNIVGIFGLLVAMLGVMNVMYAMVEERTREIGIRMALGASPSDITRERLVEGLVVTSVGGVAGMVSCAAILGALNRLPLPAEARAYMGEPHMSLGLGVGVVVLLSVAGCLAGWFPARRAAALDPVVALREE
jgi:putative ABC transport system permease protein